MYVLPANPDDSEIVRATPGVVGGVTLKQNVPASCVTALLMKVVTVGPNLAVTLVVVRTLAPPPAPTVQVLKLRIDVVLTLGTVDGAINGIPDCTIVCDSGDEVKTAVTKA